MLFPQPQKIIHSGSFSFDKPPGIKLLSEEKSVQSAFHTVFSDELSGDGITIFPLFDGSRDLGFIPETGKPSEEIYKLEISEKNGALEIKTRFQAKSGLLHAMFRIKRMLSANEFPLGEIYDYPLFETRGFIEGFYGKPWKSEERREMLRLMAEYGENTYYYAPKNDVYHRRKWRENYPEKELSELKKLLAEANKLNIRFYYCIAPGLSIRYGSEDDFKALCDKTLSLVKLGIHNFGLLLDDIPEQLFYDDDKKLFGSILAAHVSLCKRYYAFLNSLSCSCRLTVCPLQYHGEGDGEFISRFGKELPEKISVFFTGEDICSKKITVQQALLFKKSTGKRALYWDNFPVNDAEMFKEMHIAPLIGRDSELYKYCEGLISNCMEYFNCNKIPLITAAAYLWNPPVYSPELAFDAAVSFLIPENEREAFLLLADHFRSSCLKDENSRIMGRCLSNAAICIESGDFAAAVKHISEYSEKINSAAEFFKTGKSELYEELKEWTDKFIFMSDILNTALAALKANGREKRALGEMLSKKMREYNGCATLLTAFCFREYIEGLIELCNTSERFR